MVDAFKAWAARWNITNTSVAIMRRQRLIGWVGIAHTERVAQPIASESKAITAMCIGTLVDDGKLRFSTPLRVPLADYFAAHPPYAFRAPSITIGQLLTHSSGITYDPSQSKYGNKVQALGLHKTHLEEQTTLTFQRRLGNLPGQKWTYNNMNYAVLGFVIETITQTPYETYCYEHVLKPAGVTVARLNPAWRIMASWGGWKISALNYARFLAYFLPSQHMLNTTIAQWPKFPIGGGNYYTMGAIMRTDGVHHRFHHAGKWKSANPPASFGGYFGVFDEDVRYMANYEPVLTPDQLRDLSQTMFAAAKGP
jgi:CubicO group peptidase (beta-lactamase class C family)